MKKNMLRIVSLALIFIMMALMFASCGKDEDDTTTTDPPTEETTPEETTALADTTTDPDATTDLNATTDPNVTTVQNATTAATGQNATTAENVTTAPPNDEGLPKTNAEILAAYTKVMNNSKASKPAYKKKEYQSIPDSPEDRIATKGSGAINIILNLAEGAFKTESSAKIEEKDKDSDMKWFPVPKNEKGCYLDDSDFIKSANSERLSNGNIKLTIVLKDEVDAQPTPDNSGAPVSKIGAMFYPMPRSDIDDALEQGFVKAVVKMESLQIEYHDCTAIIEYNPDNDQLVELEHVTVAGLRAKGKVGFSFEFYQNIYSTMKIWDLVY